MSLKKYFFPIIVFFGITVLILFNINQPFFWDKDILDSKQAHWFLESNFNLLLPDNIDPGHPPLMGLLLAISWSIFGKYLFIGHLLMLPFAIGTVWQINRLCEIYIHNSIKNLILLLITLETALLTQMVVYSSDLVQVFFFLLSLNSILKKRQFALFIGLVFLSLTNLRGMTIAFGLFGFNLYNIIAFEKNKLHQFFRTLRIFSLASIPSISFLTYHFIAKGWMVYNESSPWAACYEKVDLTGFIRNIVIFSWRMADAGRITIWITLLSISFLFIKNHKPIDKKIKQLSVILIILLVIYLPSSLLSNHLINNRYFIPLFILLSLTTGVLLQNYYSKQNVLKALIGVLLFVQLSGNFWVYPDNISTCWSATLAHLPYYSLNDKMNKYVRDEGINLSEIGSFVPNITQEYYTKLNDENFSYHLADYSTDQYIIFSNIYNIPDDDLIELTNNWHAEKEFKSWAVKFVLYKRKIASIKQLNSISNN
ncbi:hypothetical protein [Carboxylicivirga caseinilyticus]|uniref:hypothetical protein n=1 Tax=Carboxylicivirga caseinilyticus TaxID=3417572 RepID=UPI003D357F36|nr:hypothetical protein [Marinilabiliaceae bacterium A049]